jgi:hypothetical protein
MDYRRMRQIKDSLLRYSNTPFQCLTLLPKAALPKRSALFERNNAWILKT